ncbi:hypothetical protein PFI31113_00874 [Pandoraea fibrosis]|uniref:Uncharacterized protein n=1 Tax=Pandoraea fibrosis TaxID=1891094 RepID=A0A5E4SL59_9BURK|nr:hypothetical protein PFI31113_00874 [Pandoraea fibrosis]
MAVGGHGCVLAYIVVAEMLRRVSDGSGRSPPIGGGSQLVFLVARYRRADKLLVTIHCASDQVGAQFHHVDV